MTLLPPLSDKVRGRLYAEALPPPSAALDGALQRVGFTTGYLVYRCHWNEREPARSSWSYLYHWEPRLEPPHVRSHGL